MSPLASKIEATYEQGEFEKYAHGRSPLLPAHADSPTVNLWMQFVGINIHVKIIKIFRGLMIANISIGDFYHLKSLTMLFVGHEPETIDFFVG